MNTENNKLIVNFMGLKPNQINSELYGLSKSPWLSVTGKTPEKVLEDFSKSTLYHSNWEWLMPVVEKINTIEDFRFSVIIKHCYCKIVDSTKYVLSGFEIAEDRGKDTIESVYNGVVEFIKTYNKEL